MGRLLEFIQSSVNQDLPDIEINNSILCRLSEVFYDDSTNMLAEIALRANKNPRSFWEKLLLRCPTDESLKNYLCTIARNSGKTVDKDSLFAKFYCDFTKKIRRSLHDDSRFKNQIHPRKKLYCWGLSSWDCSHKEFYDSLDGDIALRCGDSANSFGTIKYDTDSSYGFPYSSRDLASGAYRTLEHFDIFASIRLLFVLFKNTGQLPFVPGFVELNDNEKNISGLFPAIDSVEDESLRAFQRFVNELCHAEKQLFVFYIFPKSMKNKISRKDVVGLLGFRNEVTMKNHERKLLEKLKKIVPESRNSIVLFMGMLENFVEEFKTANFEPLIKDNELMR